MREREVRDGDKGSEREVRDGDKGEGGEGGK